MFIHNTSSMKSSHSFFAVCALLLGTVGVVVAAEKTTCPPPGQTPNLAGVASQFAYLLDSTCPTDYDTEKVSTACRQAQRDLYQANPALQAALETYAAAAQPVVRACYQDNDDTCNVDAKTLPGYHEFRQACQVSNSPVSNS